MLIHLKYLKYKNIPIDRFKHTQSGLKSFSLRYKYNFVQRLILRRQKFNTKHFVVKKQYKSDINITLYYMLSQQKTWIFVETFIFEN